MPDKKTIALIIAISGACAVTAGTLALATETMNAAFAIGAAIFLVVMYLMTIDELFPIRRSKLSIVRSGVEKLGEWGEATFARNGYWYLRLLLAIAIIMLVGYATNLADHHSS